MFPIALTPFGPGVSFCPAKLARDDPDFIDDMRHLYLAWQLGQVPFGTSLDTMAVDRAEMLSTLITTWTRMEREQDFRRLARLIGGDQ